MTADDAISDIEMLINNGGAPNYWFDYGLVSTNTVDIPGEYETDYAHPITKTTQICTRCGHEKS